MQNLYKFTCLALARSAVLRRAHQGGPGPSAWISPLFSPSHTQPVCGQCPDYVQGDGGGLSRSRRLWAVAVPRMERGRLLAGLARRQQGGEASGQPRCLGAAPSPGSLSPVLVSSSCPIYILVHHQALPSPKQSLLAAKSCGCLGLQSPLSPPEHCWPHRGGDGGLEGGQYFVFPMTTADWAKVGGQESPGHRCPASCAALPPRLAADRRFKGKKTCFDSSHVPSAALPPGRSGLCRRLAALFGGCKLGVRTGGGCSATCWGAGPCSRPLCSPRCLSAGAQRGSATSSSSVPRVLRAEGKPCPVFAFLASLQLHQRKKKKKWVGQLETTPKSCDVSQSICCLGGEAGSSALRSAVFVFLARTPPGPPVSSRGARCERAEVCELHQARQQNKEHM